MSLLFYLFMISANIEDLSAAILPPAEPAVAPATQTAALTTQCPLAHPEYDFTVVGQFGSPQQKIERETKREKVWAYKDFSLLIREGMAVGCVTDTENIAPVRASLGTRNLLQLTGHRAWPLGVPPETILNLQEIFAALLIAKDDAPDKKSSMNSFSGSSFLERAARANQVANFRGGDDPAAQEAFLEALRRQAEEN